MNSSNITNICFVTSLLGPSLVPVHNETISAASCMAHVQNSEHLPSAIKYSLNPISAGVPLHLRSGNPFLNGSDT